ncbi:hypothetical protein EUA02_15700 [Mycobacterium paragordonae]|nr:hypothetical protein EUA02_15700 [Mycobacterium paragordonae]TDL11381.1 hypothetical protein EUA05_04680 [Mycobacterium paragordonae]
MTRASRRRGGNGPVHRFVRGAGDAETVDIMVAGGLPSKLHPKVLRRKVFAVPGGTSARLAFVVSCMKTAAPRCRTPGLACSSGLLNSLREVLCAVTADDRLHWRSVASDPIERLSQ